MNEFGLKSSKGSLKNLGLANVANAYWNFTPSQLVEDSLILGHGQLASTGALAIDTGEFTGRSPKDRFTELGQPAWLTLWSSSGIPEEELGVGVGARPTVAGAHLSEPEAEGPVQLLQYDRDDANYVLRVSLSRGRVLTVVAPPFVDPTLASPLSPLLAGGLATVEDPLTLIPLSPGDERERAPLQWIPTDAGWQGELPLNFPNALYHAHYAVDLPGTLLATARGTLLLLSNLLLFMFFWLVGQRFRIGKY